MSALLMFWYLDRSNHSAFDLAKALASVWKVRPMIDCTLIDSGDGEGDNSYDVKDDGKCAP